MLNKHEITSLSLSPTKKDFVQIWNELLDVAGKLSERWDPTSTNESDPGIVILKALTGIADKLNYNIDKNTLEAFMPTAAQEESMRKLCDMLGYNVKYYRSAVTDVTVKYHNSEPSEEEVEFMKSPGHSIPKFTVITNSDQDISYFTTKESTLISADEPIIKIECMEGQIVKCESLSDNNIITANQISDNNRFYLPETQIAENGIFIYNVSTGLLDEAKWEKVDNLNIQTRGSRVFKFGFDSYESRPYIEFPEDYSELFNDGVFIYYTRTSGVNGNVSPRTLSTIELPTGDDWSKVSSESFSVENAFAATTGADIETIKQAYNNFKKTIGTFDTLVTCRDYMNKIYSMVDDKNKPYVSNILVTDIRNDINRALTICSCDDSGIFYKETPKTELTTKKLKLSGTDEYALVEDRESAIDHFNIVLYPYKTYNQIKNNVTSIRDVYDSSFDYSIKNFELIEDELSSDKYKTIAHKIATPRGDNKHKDIVSINNYMRLSATIATNSKITVEEGSMIKDSIKIALANAFNMRELDFGEAIPFDSIMSVIEDADPRIRLVSLNEPVLYTTFTRLDGYEKDTGLPILREYAVASKWLTEEMAEATGRFSTFTTEDGEVVNTFNSDEAKKIYNYLVVRNILAGRIPLFNYNKSFKSDFNEAPYLKATTTSGKQSDQPSDLPKPDVDNPLTVLVGDNNSIYTSQLKKNEDGEYITEYTVIAPQESFGEQDNVVESGVISDIGGQKIVGIKTSCEIHADDSGEIHDVELSGGEYVRFRAPNFITTKTYPAYVNYHLDRKSESQFEAKAASAVPLFDVLNSDINSQADDTTIKWQKVLNYFKNLDSVAGSKTVEKFSLTKKISVDKASTSDDSDITIEIENSGTNNEYSLDTFLNSSGCVIVTNDNLEAKLTWLPEDNQSEPNGAPISKPIKLSSAFITSTSDLGEIKDRIDEILLELEQTNSLPTSCSWSISFNFECVPFSSRTFTKWEDYIKKCVEHKKNNTFFEYQVLEDSIPVEVGGRIFWRLFEGSYSIGKHVPEDNKKLLTLSSNYLGLLGYNPIRNAYLMTDEGSDEKSAVITNGMEYMLDEDEYLYIEYTPSSTNEDGTTQEQAPVTEIYGPGTIIKPSGFEVGLIDSDVLTRQGTTPFKTVNFATASTSVVSMPMHRFGANEQVEIRDFAEVVLNKAALGNKQDNKKIFVYKNFNGCDELEDARKKGTTRKYTLKDNEYIFYTDYSKMEFAYFGSGTEVTLSGNVVIDKNEEYDIAAILDMDIQSIPWKAVSFNTDSDEIRFQEFQYITLGPDDKLQQLKLINGKSLTRDWAFCDDGTEVIYQFAGNESTEKLTPIAIKKNNFSGNTRPGNGWEACSLLELNVSSTSSQTVRSTGKITTSIILEPENPGNDDPKTYELVLALDDPALSFKTNISCQSGSSYVNINDKSLYKSDDVDGFELKVFAADEPVIVETKRNKAIPYDDAINILDWQGTTEGIVKEYNDLWTRVDLVEISAGSDIEDYDRALRLPINLLKDTYGIFCVYVSYTSEESNEESNSKTWIEVLPGTKTSDITLLNLSYKQVESQWELADRTDPNNINISDKLLLRPGINCIRVNKSCRIFIKTSPDAQGVLLFDELRLVNRKYGNDTIGLNLDQLGYFAIDSDEAKLSLDTRAVKQAAIAEATEEHLSHIHQNQKNEVSSVRDVVTPKLNKLVDTETAIINELTALVDTYVSANEQSHLTNLFLKYYEIQDAIDKETALTEALLENSNISDVEQQLNELLGDFNSISTEQDRLLKELEELKDSLPVDVSGLSTSVLLKYYNKKCVDSDQLKAAYRDLVEKHFSEQLAALSKNMDSIVNSQDRSNLLAALESVQAIYGVKNKGALELQTNQLLSSIDRSSVEEVISTAYDAALSANYSVVAAKLVQLRELVESKDIQTIADKIEEAITDSNLVYLKDLMDELHTLINSATTASPALISTINSMITHVQQHVKAGTTAVDEEVLTFLTDCREVVLDYYDTKLSAILTNVQNTLSEINEESFNLAISYLQGSQDTQVQLCVDQLNNIVTELTNNLADETINNFISSYDKVTFGKDAVLSCWTSHLQTEATTTVESLYELISDIIKSLSIDEKFNLSSNLPEALASNDLFKQVIGYEKFEDFVDKAKELINKNSQTEANISFIEGIDDNTSFHKDVKDAMKEISSGNDARQSAIRGLITKLEDSSISIAEKQQALSSLVEELNSSISTNTKLQKLVANLLCPSLLIVDDQIANDSFYGKLVEQINTCVANIKTICTQSAGHGSTIRSTIDSEIQNFEVYKECDSNLLAVFNETDFNIFKSRLIHEVSSGIANTLLSTSTVNDTLSSIKNSCILLNDVESIGEIDLYAIPTEDDETLLSDKLAKLIDDENAEKITDVDLIEFISSVISRIVDLETRTRTDGDFDVVDREQQLLADIRELDVDNEFYYNVPVELSRAIEFNEDDPSKNTMLNPLVNFDINNVNNNFVISKLDIDYIEKGMQLARSSRLN